MTLTDAQAASSDLTFTMPANDVTLTAAWADAVADVNGTKFTDLQKAFDYAAENPDMPGAICLLKDVPVDQPITISGGNVALTCPAGTNYALTGSGLSTLEVNRGTLIVDNHVTVKNTSSNGTGINCCPNTTLYVRGTVNGAAGITANDCTLTVEDSAVISGGSGCGIVQSKGNLIISGGTISGHTGLSVTSMEDNGLDVKLLGGTFIGNGGSAIAATKTTTTPHTPPPCP